MNKLMYLTESSGLGGAEQYLLYLVAGREPGCEVSVALPFRKHNEAFRDALRDKGATVLDLPQFTALYPINFLIALFFLAVNKPARLHFSLPYADSCRWSLLAAAVLGVKYLITEHLVPPDPFLAGWYFAITHVLFNPLKKLSYRRALRVITVSGDQRATLTTKYGMPADKISVIHNGIECSRYGADAAAAARLRDELRIAAGSTVITNIGRLAEQKGQRYLVEAMEILVKRGLPVPVTVLVVGDGPLRGALEEEAQRRGVQDLIRFTGFRRDIADILSVTDIFVLPSLNEGFPLTLLEAMAAGKPAVASRVTGTSEAVAEGETGLLCAPASPEDLAEKLLLLLEDRERRILMGERARQAARNKFDVSIMVEKTRSLYRECFPCAGP